LTEKVFNLTPKAKRGLITSKQYAALGEFTDSLSVANGIYSENDSWIVQNVSGSLTFGVGSSPTWAQHFYNAIDTTSATASPQTIWLTHLGSNTSYTGSATLYRQDTAAAVTVNGVNFTTTKPHDVFFLNVKNRCFVAGSALGASVVPTVITKYPSATSYPWGKGGAQTDLTYDAYTQATNANTKVFYQAANGNATAGVNTITAAAGTPYTASPTWDGKTVIFDNGTGGVDSYTISTSTTTVLTLTANITGAGARNGKNVEVHFGELSWGTIPPSYAFAYYNPATGHISSINPILTLSDQSVSTVRVRLNGIAGTNDTTNYTRIVLFRTARDGGVLFPLKLDVGGGGGGGEVTVNASDFMIVNNYSGSLSYNDFQPDQRLGGILGRVQAPTLNDPPPADLIKTAYWNGRIFGISASVPWRLRFSQHPAEVGLGVAEECWPAINFYDIPSDDGFITAVKAVSGGLLVCTERFTYFMGGNNLSNFQLVRISTRGSGVSQYSIDEHPGDADAGSSSIIYVSRDRRMWRQYGGGQIVDIGWPIQNTLDQIDFTSNRPVIIRVFNRRKKWFCALGIAGISPDGNYLWLFYDFDYQQWSDLSQTVAGLWSGVVSGIYYTGSTTAGEGYYFQALASGTTTNALLAGVTSLVVSGSTIASQHLDFGDPEALKTISEIAILGYLVAGDTLGVEYDRSTFVTSYNKLTEVATSRASGGVLADLIERFMPPAPKQFRTARIVFNPGGGAPGSTPYAIQRIIVRYKIATSGATGVPN
jgi:hypothetical protein